MNRSKVPNPNHQRRERERKERGAGILRIIYLSRKRAFFLEYDVLVRLELFKPATHRLSHDDLLAEFAANGKPAGSARVQREVRT
jgi:hypothetical protein